MILFNDHAITIKGISSPDKSLESINLIAVKIEIFLISYNALIINSL